jgi:2-haloalkanoic acid dehalogenase type II
MKLTDFKALTFDCYGTLIDWESGMVEGLRPLTSRLDRELSRDEILEAHARHESAQQAWTPAKRYAELLAIVYKRLAEEWGVPAPPEDCDAYGRSIKDWPAFPDSVGALQYLKKHYKLVILSNADDSFLDQSVPRLEANFHAVLTAEKAGYYKPRYGAFEYMLEQLDAEPDDFVHVSSHTRYDPMPMHDMGFRNLVLLDRGYDPVPPGYGLTVVKSLDELNTMLGI